MIDERTVPQIIEAIGKELDKLKRTFEEGERHLQIERDERYKAEEQLAVAEADLLDARAVASDLRRIILDLDRGLVTLPEALDRLRDFPEYDNDD